MHGDADNDKIYGLGRLYGDAGDDWLEATNVKGQPNRQWYVYLVGGDGWTRWSTPSPGRTPP